MITRNNYEEFFLLYVDNELSPADRQAVERFVDEHPDLKEEWELLLQCRVNPDETPSFSGKELLLRSESREHPLMSDTLIHAGNYESWFLAFVDNELDASSRQAVIDFTRQHPEKNIELQQLMRTVSTPDQAIIFPDKELLYHEEGGRKKLSWLPYAGIAAAALVLGAVGLLIFYSYHTPVALASANSNAASAAKNLKPGVTPPPAHPYYSTKKDDGQQAASLSRNDGGQQIASLSHKDGGQQAGSAPREDAGQQAASLLHKDDGQRNALLSHKDGDATASATRKENRRGTPVMAKADPVRPATLPTDPGRDLAVVDPATIDRTAKLPVTLAVARDGTRHDAAAHDAAGNRNASFATQALLSQASYLSSSEEPAAPRKNKWRGIFRKVTRVLEKPAARVDDDNKNVTIGGFQFALE